MWRRDRAKSWAKVALPSHLLSCDNSQSSRAGKTLGRGWGGFTTVEFLLENLSWRREREFRENISLCLVLFKCRQLKIINKLKWHLLGGVFCYPSILLQFGFKSRLFLLVLPGFLGLILRKWLAPVSHRKPAVLSPRILHGARFRRVPWGRGKQLLLKQWEGGRHVISATGPARSPLCSSSRAAFHLSKAWPPPSLPRVILQVSACTWPPHHLRELCHDTRPGSSGAPLLLLQDTLHGVIIWLSSYDD